MLVGFVLCVFAVCLVYDDDGPMDYVQVLPQFSFAALNSRWPGTLICITAHAMSYSVVNDLAKAMKALDGKNRSHSSIALYASDPVWGGTVRSAGVPNAKMKALSSNVAAGMAIMPITARRMSLSFTS